VTCHTLPATDAVAATGYHLTRDWQGRQQARTSYCAISYNMERYSNELHVAILAVQRAAMLTDRVYRDLTNSVQTKGDRSPVTIGDYGAQALIISAIRHNFPDDTIIGEEDATALRTDGKYELQHRIWELVRTTNHPKPNAEEILGGSIPTVDAMLDLIDVGQCTGHETARFWTVDPIDGTKGFLRGGQYAICLGLVVGGQAVLGVLGCPHLPISNYEHLESATILPGSHDSLNQGVIFSAVSGHGASIRSLWDYTSTEGQKIHASLVCNSSEACFCESFDPGHSNHEFQALVAGQLGITRPSVRMDSQAKYASVARGAADIYIALPRDQSYKFKIWDHVPGEIIVREAGGVVTDFNGKPLDFSTGREMTSNCGVIACGPNLHGQVLETVRNALALPDSRDHI
jgi:3'(2'), 5'-bisphosphate nucleotidase